jgi:hypothetical protein
MPDRQPDKDERGQDVVQAGVDVVREDGEHGYGVDRRVERALDVDAGRSLEVEQPPPAVHRCCRLHADESAGEHVHAVQGCQQGQLPPPGDARPRAA